MSQRHVGPCWVIRDATGHPWNEDHDSHHDTRLEADVEVGDLRDNTDLHDDDDALRLAGLTAVQLQRSCVVITCDECGESPENDEGFACIHFEPGEWQPADWEWTQDGPLDHCGECPPLGPSKPGLEIPGQLPLIPTEPTEMRK